MNIDPYGLLTWGFSFGAGAGFKGKAVGESVTVAFDHNGDFIVLHTPEGGFGTSGVSGFARGVLGLGDNTVDNLLGPGISASGTKGVVSGSVTLPYVHKPTPTSPCEATTPWPYGTHGFNDPIIEVGVGGGEGVSLTVGNGKEVFRSSILGDIGRWIGGTAYDLLH